MNVSVSWSNIVDIFFICLFCLRRFFSYQQINTTLVWGFICCRNDKDVVIWQKKRKIEHMVAPQTGTTFAIISTDCSVQKKKNQWIHWNPIEQPLWHAAVWRVHVHTLQHVVSDLLQLPEGERRNPDVARKAASAFTPFGPFNAFSTLKKKKEEKKT